MSYRAIPIPTKAGCSIHRAASLTGAHPDLHWDLHERRRQLASDASARAMGGMFMYDSSLAAGGGGVGKRAAAAVSARYAAAARESAAQDCIEPAWVARVRDRVSSYRNYRDMYADYRNAVHRHYMRRTRNKNRNSRPALNASDVFEFSRFRSGRARGARENVWVGGEFYGCDQDHYWRDDYDHEEDEDDYVTDEVESAAGSWTDMVDFEVDSDSPSDSDAEWESIASVSPSDSDEDIHGGWEHVSSKPTFADVLKVNKCWKCKPASVTPTFSPVISNCAKAKVPCAYAANEMDLGVEEYHMAKSHRGGKAKHMFKRERRDQRR